MWLSLCFYSTISRSFGVHGFNDNRRHSAPRSSAERQFRLPTRTTWTIAFYRQVQSTSRCSSLETLNAMRGKPSPELESASPFPATPSAGLPAAALACLYLGQPSRPVRAATAAQTPLCGARPRAVTPRPLRSSATMQCWRRCRWVWWSSLAPASPTISPTRRTSSESRSWIIGRVRVDLVQDVITAERR